MYQFDTLLKIIFLTFIAVSCGGTGNSDLTISVSKQAFIIPAGTMNDTCYQGTPASPVSISAPYFSLPQISTTWKGAGTLLPVVLKITVNTNSNITNLSCALTSSAGNISSQLGFTTPNGNISIGSAKFVSATSSSCPIICGGLSISNPKNAFTITGTIKLLAIQTIVDSNNQSVQVPVSTTDTFTLQNLP